MVIQIVDKTDAFVKSIKKIRDNCLKEKLQKQIEKIINEPETGKPMMYARKNTREVYVSPFRLSYVYVREQNKIIFLEVYHKDEQ